MGDTYSTRQRSRSGGAASAARRSIAHRNAARVFPEPVGAWIRVCEPSAIASHPRSWAAVGSENEDVNHARVDGLNRSSDVIATGYRTPVTGSWAQHIGLRDVIRVEFWGVKGGSRLWLATMRCRAELREVKRDNGFRRPGPRLGASGVK